MTLGCGGYGGNITSDNIQPRHLLNIKRLAYEVTPVSSARAAAPASAPGAGLPKAPAGPPLPAGIAAGPLTRRIDEFLASRGYVAPGASPAGPVKGENAPPPLPPAEAKTPGTSRVGTAGLKAARVCLRRRRPAGVTPGSQARHRGAHDRHAGRAGLRRGAPPLRRGGLATLENSRVFVLPIEQIGVRVDHPSRVMVFFYSQQG